MKAEHTSATLGLAQCGQMRYWGREALVHLLCHFLKGECKTRTLLLSSPCVTVLGYLDDVSEQDGSLTVELVPAVAAAEELLLCSMCSSCYVDQVKASSVFYTVTRV